MTIDNIACDKCQGKMEFSGNMTSGNSKYNLYRCQSCNAEKMKCVGILEKKQPSIHVW